MIINAGLGKFIGKTKDGGMRVFHIEDWVNEWKQKDVLDDAHQYGKDRNIADNLGSADEVRNAAKNGSAEIDEDGFVSIKEVLMQEGKKENLNNGQGFNVS